MKTVVALDGDGVMFNSLYLHYKSAICGVLKELGLPPVTFDCVRLTCHPPFGVWWEKQGVKLPTVELWTKYHRHMENSPVPDLMPGVLDFCRRCRKKGISLVLITASSNTAIRILEKYPELQNELSKTFMDAQDKVSTLMSLPRIFDVPPEQVVMVGDMRSDILDARLAGIDVVGFNYPYQECSADVLTRVRESLLDAGAQYICDSMEDLCNHLGI